MYLRDRSAGTIEFISIPRWWWPSFVVGGSGPLVSDDGSSVILQDAAPYQESPSSIYRPIVQRARDGFSNLRSLKMYDAVSAGSSFTITGYDAPASPPFWVLRSNKRSGSSYQGLSFDLASKSGGTWSDSNYVELEIL